MNESKQATHLQRYIGRNRRCKKAEHAQYRGNLTEQWGALPEQKCWRENGLKIGSPPPVYYILGILSRTKHSLTPGNSRQLMRRENDNFFDDLYNVTSAQQTVPPFVRKRSSRQFFSIARRLKRRRDSKALTSPKSERILYIRPRHLLP